jgi:hypothetical protein
VSAASDVKVPQCRAKLRLAWILVSAALVFALGFVAKVWMLSH